MFNPLEVDRRNDNFNMDIKTVKLKTHPRNFSEENLIVNIEQLNKEKIKLQIGAIIELSPPDGQGQDRRKNHLYLEIKSLPPDIQARATPLSINAELASEFRLGGVRDICLRVVDSADISLDLLELSIKDQALTRSDMWRFTLSLAGKCVFSNQKLEFAGMRAQVHRLWTIGESVRSGSISNVTRVLYRSSSAHTLLFIQIGAEMWDFDLSGNYYFDKAVDGFLKDLLQKWKDHNCSHEVTIMFFWRTYYNVQSRDQFPEYTSRSVRQNKKGEYYQDFYKVIMDCDGFQQEISSVLLAIKKNFLSLSLTSNDNSLPSAHVSSSSSGNILEAINLALNVFESKHIDVNFGVTGQQMIIVTSGQGVFDVEYDLSRLTKDRVMDRGVAIDLICLNPQPLHAVPLFKFYRPDGDIYTIPHWMNYSYYDPCHVWDKFHFRPKLLISDHLVNQYLKCDKQSTCKKCASHDENVRSSLEWVDYDEFDASVFKPSGAALQSSFTPRRQRRVRTLSHESESFIKPKTSGITFNVGTPDSNDSGDETPFVEHEERSAIGSGSGFNPKAIVVPLNKRSSSKELSSGAVYTSRSSRARHHSTNELENASLDRATEAGSMVLSYTASMESFHRSHRPSVASLVGGPPRKKKPFINPFDPKKVHSELAAHHRRWIHAFPRNTEGQVFQQHHTGGGEKDSPPSPARSQRSTGSADSHSARSSQVEGYHPPEGGARPAQGEPHPPEGTSKVSQTPRLSEGNISATFPLGEGHHASPSHLTLTEAGNISGSGSEVSLRREDSITNAVFRRHRLRPQSSSTLAPSRGGTRFMQRDSRGVENFASVQRTGTDWQSLTEPACLPITCDYFPSDSELSQDFVEHPFTVVVSALDSNNSTSQSNFTWRSCHSSMNTFQAFREMISQRIVQGFQLVFEDGEGGIFSLNQSLSDLERVIQTQKAPSDQRSSSFPKLNVIRVKMSLGRLFHHIELNHPDILVHIYKAKSSTDTYIFNYTYQLCADDLPVFHTTYTEFSSTRTADYNWNYLDQHVCGYQDFEQLQESQRYFLCRFLLLPRDCPSGGRSMCEELVAGFVRFVDFINHLKRGHPAERARRSNVYRHSLPTIITSQHAPQPGFYPGPELLPEIVEEAANKPDSPNGVEKGGVGGATKPPALLKLKSIDDPKIGGKTSGLGGGKRAESQGAGLNIPVQRSKSKEELSFERLEGRSEGRQSSVPKRARGEVIQDMKKLLKEEPPPAQQSDGDVVDIALLKEMRDGLEVITPQSGLRSHCIIAADAVKWLVENKQLPRREAVELLQKICAQRSIVHASNDDTIGFIDGYYLYTIPPLYQDGADDQTSHSADGGRHDAFSKYWFEMSIEMPSEDVDPQGTWPVSPVSTSSATTQFTSLDHSPPLYYRGTRRKDSIASSLHLTTTSNLVEMNPDTSAKSDRPEWCYVHYDHTYNHKRAFQFEFQWVAATPCLFYQLMQLWVNKASLCGFYLVPTPSKHTFQESSDACYFRRRRLIILNLPGPIAKMWMECDGEVMMKNATRLISAITRHFGFLIDASSGPQDTPQDGSTLSSMYVHYNGYAFLQPLLASIKPSGEGGADFKCGFYWYKNYLATKQKSLGTGGVSKHDTLLTEFTSFCNDKVQLQDLYNLTFEPHSVNE